MTEAVEADVEARACSLHVPLPHADGLTLHVRRWGKSAPEFLFIHGLGEGHFVWDHVVSAFLPRVSALAVDLRGHGDSDRDPSRIYETQMLVADVSAVFRALCSAPVILVGHSLGAEIALHLAMTQRDKIRGVVFVDGGPELNTKGLKHIHSEFAKQPWWYPTREDYICHLQEKMPLCEPALLRALAPHALRKESEGGYALKCDRAWTEDRGGTPSEDLWSLFRSIDLPFLVARGISSAILSRETAARMALENGHCWLKTVPLAGHAVMLENPSGFIAAMQGYVSMLSAAGR